MFDGNRIERIERTPKEELVVYAFRSLMGDGFPIRRGDICHSIDCLRKLERNKRTLEQPGPQNLDFPSPRVKSNLKTSQNQRPQNEVQNAAFTYDHKKKTYEDRNRTSQERLNEDIPAKAPSRECICKRWLVREGSPAQEGPRKGKKKSNKVSH
ncbi:Pentatricopeptide repeat-containing protein, mitochondrial, partial [Cucurbita argyrosperma subsp. sororia]